MKATSVSEIAKHLNAAVHGNKENKITAIKPLSEAGAGDLSFFAPTSKKQHAELFKLAVDSSASAILTHKKHDEITATQIEVANPLASLVVVSKLLYEKPAPAKGIHKTAVVEKSASISKSAHIGAFCYVGNNVTIEDGVIIHPHSCIYDGVKIGKDSLIHAGVVIREEVVIEENCIIQAGAIIGGDGFGYVSTADGHEHIPHIGTTHLATRVEVGSNATVDRGTLGKTSIGLGTKIDNLVTIGHNVSIGKDCLLCGQVGISGSTSLGNNVILGGQAGVADHVTVGNFVRAAAKTGIVTTIKDNQDVAGFPAIPAQDWRRSMSVFRKLPEIYRALKGKLI